MKKLLSILLSVLMFALLFSGCAKKTVHCDNCGKEIKVSADSKVDDSWSLFCRDCEKDLGIDKIVPVE